jgi:(2Fe-2S) ferredoxin
MPLAHHLFVCNHQKTEIGDEVAKALKTELKKQGLKSWSSKEGKQHNRVQTCNCLDLCKHCKKGPGAALVVYPEGVFYGRVRPQDAADIVSQHLGAGKTVARLLLDPQ